MNRQRSDAAKAPHAAGSLGWWLTVTIVTALVAGYAWSHPTTETTDVPATYTSTYHFSYDGDIPAGSGVYNGDTMRFGDPVYLKVLDRIDVAVDFSFLAASLDITSDNSQLTTQVLLSSDAGWSRLLVDEHLPFEGTAATARIGVDFAQAQRVAAELADTTGVTGAVQVAVVVGVTSDLTIAGRISGGPLRHDVSAATLVFDLGPDAATVHGFSPLAPDEVVQAIENGSLTGGTSQADTAAVQSTATTVNQIVDHDMTVSIGGWNMDIHGLRTVSLVALAVFMCVLMWGDISLWIARRRGEAAYLEARFGADIHTVTDVPAGLGAEAVWLGSFESLAAMAENAEAEILHHRGSELDRYFVFDGPRVYAYLAERAATIDDVQDTATTAPAGGDHE